ncbi:MAG: DEDD exonuclease domain-containing protein [Carbonactinosporaceae bacterium]
MSAATGAAHATGVQGTFDELGTPLREVTFVVLDLETTGMAPSTAAITEVGAVKVRGGEVLGEFQTLVDPGTPVPAFVSVLTGITPAMLAGAPPLAGVLASLLEFVSGCVLVAHNAPFDLAFLKAGCERHGYPWPGNVTVDTARLARRVLTRDEVPDCKLATLARHFRASCLPTHRALADSRATVDVLHGLIERLGPLGVRSLEELTTFTQLVSPAQRRKRHLAEALPRAPGVYLFEDGRGRVLYVGKSIDLRARVRSYFTGAETRARITEMIGLCASVTPIVCETGLEAEVRELRLIAEYKPRYNRRSRFPERALWITITREPYPRLSIVRKVKADGATYLGPFPSRRLAEQAMLAVYAAVPVRQCTLRLSPRRKVSACALHEMGRCHAPCEGLESVDDYAVHVEAVRAAMTQDIRPVVDPVLRRVAALSGAQRYEDAAVHRDRLAAFVRAAGRMQRLAGLTACPEVVAAQPRGAGGYELAVIRFGRLAGAALAPPGAAPGAHIDALVATAETVDPGPGPTPAASAEETECVLRWLAAPGTRLVSVAGTWCSPAHGAERLRARIDAGYGASRAGWRAAQERSGPRPSHRPAR